MVQKVQKVVDVPQIEVEEQVVEVPVAKHVQVPMIQKVQKIVATWSQEWFPAVAGLQKYQFWCFLALIISGLGCGFPALEDVPQIEIEEQLVEVPVTKHVQVPLVQKVQKMVEVPQVEYEDQVVDVPVQKQVHIPFQQAMGDGVKWDESA